MARICERPTCSQPADVSYGIDPDGLVVTIEVYDDERSRLAGVLCRDHADSMMVPNGWTLDDRREIAPRLFQTRESVKVKPRRRVRRRRLTDDDTGQLRMVVTDDIPEEIPGPEETPGPSADEAEPRQRPSGVAPWQPVFDQTDDLDGLLAARSPLLARAFGKRGKDESARPAAPKGQPGERR